jgi:putative transcriptional regulator
MIVTRQDGSVAENLSRWSRVHPAPGQLLIAAPMLADDTFTRTVLYLLEHDDDGSAAVILNRPSRTPLGQVLPDWHEVASNPPVVFSGGPVQPDAALCLGWLTAAARRRSSETSTGDDVEAPHRAGAAVRPVVDAICTVDLDSEVDAISAETTALRVYAGHAGWAPGQLDEELSAGAWFVVPGGPHDVFSSVPDGLRSDVLRRQPVPLRLLATYPRDPALN